ncbi:MAG: OsmC family protein [Arenimonas sp.]
MTIIHTVRAFAGTTPYTVSLTDDLEHEWLADEPLDEGGANTGPSPKLILLSSLGACTAITLQMYAARKKWPLESIEVELQLNPDGDSASGNDISRKIGLKGELSTEQRERLLQIANACPVHKVLTGEVRIASSLID